MPAYPKTVTHAAVMAYRHDNNVIALWATGPVNDRQNGANIVITEAAAIELLSVLGRALAGRQ